MTDDRCSNGGRRRPGYRQPPVEHQFRKGTSGNPKGRPRRKLPGLQAIVKAELGKPLTVTQNGERATVTALEAIIRRAVGDALAGSPTERRLVIKLLTQFLPPEAATQQPPGFIVSFVRNDEDL